MKYNNDYLELSSKACNSTSLTNNVCSDEIKTMQDNLLQTLLKRFKLEFEEGQIYNGILKIRIKEEFYKDPEEGYKEITELIDKGNFSSFFQNYFIYLGSIKDTCDEFGYAYYEIIWDYKNYFEVLSLFDIVGQIDANILKKYENLPIEYQRQVLSMLNNNIKKYVDINSHDKVVKTCKEEGHQFDKWKHKTWYTYEDAYIDHQLIKNYKVKHECWQRKCSRCGYVENSAEMPKELIEERLEKNKQAQIRRLERKLAKLKGE